MNVKISDRLAEIVKALPIKKGMRVLEIGCGPGVAARDIANQYADIYVLAIDRSAKAIKQAKIGSSELIASGKLKFRNASIETFKLSEDEQPFDLAFAIRVGALDGRHPEKGKLALAAITKALTTKGKLFIDGGTPLKEISLDQYR